MGYCILGCRRVKGGTRHMLPKNPERRALWLKQIGKEDTNVKTLYLCGRHFSEGMTLGKKINMIGFPDLNLNPVPERKKLERQHFKNSPMPLNKPRNSAGAVYPVLLSTTPTGINNVSPKSLTNSNSKLAKQPITDEAIEISSSEDELEHENELNKNEEESSIKSDVFEIRHRTSNEIILKGRYVQFEDNPIISYTFPNKVSLAQQVNNLEKKSKVQKRKLNILKAERLRLSKDLKKYKNRVWKLEKKLVERKGRSKFYSRLMIKEI